MIKGLFVAKSGRTPLIELRWSGSIFFISLQMCSFKKKINEGRFLIKADADPSCPWCCYMFCCCCGCCYLIWAFIYLCISPWQQEIAALIFLLELEEQKGGGPVGVKCFCLQSLCYPGEGQTPPSLGFPLLQLWRWIQRLSLAVSFSPSFLEMQIPSAQAQECLWK